MRMKNPSLGKIIQDQRTALKLSQKEVCKRLGFTNNSGQYISEIEQGKSNFNPKRLAKLSLIICVPLEKLKAAMVSDYISCLNGEIDKSI